MKKRILRFSVFFVLITVFAINSCEDYCMECLYSDLYGSIQKQDKLCGKELDEALADTTGLIKCE
jgi:hypothetical protein